MRFQGSHVLPTIFQVSRRRPSSGNEMIQILLPIHILAGIFALISAALAVSSEKGKRLHVLSGRTYFWSMATIFLTAIPMSIISSNIFLFLIAIFSFYLAFAGMRFARNRKGGNYFRLDCCQLNDFIRTRNVGISCNLFLE